MPTTGGNVPKQEPPKLTDEHLETASTDEAVIADEVSAALDEEERFAKTLNFEKVKSGEWFYSLLHRVARSYDRNARAAYFRKKYPGLEPDEIADTLTSVTVRYAAVAGGITGAAATASQVAALGSAGMTASLFAGTIGSEMLYLARIQMRLVLDLSVVYDLQLDPDDPEDVLMVLSYALGVAPTGLVGSGALVVAREGTTRVIKRYVSKGTLEAIQRFAARLGIRILQRTIIKYTVPVVSAAVGSGYNFVTTAAMARIAKAHIKNRYKVNEELRSLLSRRHTYDLAFPAAVLHVGKVDGELSLQEYELYRAMLSRMSFPDHSPDDFQALMADEATVLDAVSEIEDAEMRRSLMAVLVLMAACDGEITEEERLFLASAAERLHTPLNLEEVERKASSHRIAEERNVAERASAFVTGAASRTAGKARDVAAKTGEGIGRAVGKALGRRRNTDARPPCPSNRPE